MDLQEIFRCVFEAALAIAIAAGLYAFFLLAMSLGDIL